jgi:hypothetical protein
MYEKGPKIPIEITPYTDEEVEKAKNYVKSWAGEEVSSANPTTRFTIDTVTPVRLWRHVPTNNIHGSSVIGLAWDDEGNLHGTCGKDGKPEYAFKIVPRDHFVFESKEAAEQDEMFFLLESIYNGSREMPTWTDADGKFCVEAPQSYRFKLEYLKPIDQMCDCRMNWLNANQLPKAVEVAQTDKKVRFLQLTLPLLNGFRYPVQVLNFVVTMPGEIKYVPNFTSIYRQTSMASDLKVNFDGNMLTGSSIVGLNDHEAVTMTMVVPNEMFPSISTYIREGNPELIPMLAFAGLALLYWLLTLRTLPQSLT